VSFNKYLRIEPKWLVITAALIVILCGIVAPIYLTKEFSNRKSLRDAYRASYSVELREEEVLRMK
jgi:ABC-type phosphate transport system permease subunit